jgi:hypothetical protein
LKPSCIAVLCNDFVGLSFQFGSDVQLEETRLHHLVKSCSHFSRLVIFGISHHQLVKELLQRITHTTHSRTSIQSEGGRRLRKVKPVLSSSASFAKTSNLSWRSKIWGHGRRETDGTGSHGACLIDTQG